MEFGLKENIVKSSIKRKKKLLRKFTNNLTFEK
jgi:hypothetical protein